MVRADGLSPDALYVATEGSDTWSGRLAAANADRSDGPLLTIAAAQAAMRAMSGPRLTYVRQGAYFLAASLRFGPADAASTIEAYPGEQAILYGGVPLKNGRATERGVMTRVQIPVAAGVGLPQLILAGHRLPNARVPAVGPGDDHEVAWLFADSSPDTIDPHRSFRVRSRDIGILASATRGGFVSIFGRRGWQNYVLSIKEWDPATRVVTLDGSTWDGIGEGSRFALLNAETTAETWRIDPNAGTLQIGSGQAAAATSDIVEAALPCIVSIDQSHDVTLTGLRLVGSATEGAAICLARTQHVTLDRLDIAETGDGIRLDRATQTQITGSEITQTAGFGIVLRHGSDNTVVRGNWLHDIGWLHQDASAIWFDASSHNRYVQNRVENVAKFAIGGGSLSDGGAYDNLIEGNEIDRANQRTSDGGAIMVIGWAQDATRDAIRRNVVTRTSALGNMGWDGRPHVTFLDPVTSLVSEAIYLDDWASGVEVSGNLLCRNVGGIELHAGWDNDVHDNILIGNAGIALAIDAENWLGAGARPHAMEHNQIERNVVFLDRSSTGQSGVTAVRGGAKVAQFDRNIYAGPGLNAWSFHHERDTVWSDYSFGIEAWRRRGQDANSSVGPAEARMVLQDGAVHVVGAVDPPAPLPLDGIGRPQDRAGLLERVRERCALP